MYIPGIYIYIFLVHTVYLPGMCLVYAKYMTNYAEKLSSEVFGARSANAPGNIMQQSFRSLQSLTHTHTDTHPVTHTPCDTHTHTLKMISKHNTPAASPACTADLAAEA